MGCFPINSRLSPYFAFFCLCFSPVSVFSSIFCLSSFSSEALGFPGGNIRVVTVTVLRFSTLFFQLYTRYVHYSCLFLVAFVLLVVSGLLRQVALRLGVGFLVARAFSGGFDYVLGVFRVVGPGACF